MNKITFKIYPSECAGMISYLHTFNGMQKLPLAQQTVSQLVLIEYAKIWRMERIMAWGGKSPKKDYSISLPLPVARALHLEMQCSQLGHWQYLFLGKLDQAITNYSHPLSKVRIIEVGPSFIDSYQRD